MNQIKLENTLAREQLEVDYYYASTDNRYIKEGDTIKIYSSN